MAERERERMADQGSQAKIYAGIENHRKHHGTLVLREVDDDEQASYMCGLCVTPGFGPRYDCSRCDNMRIHRHCASLLQLSRPCFLHPDEHHMSLVIVGEGVLPCKACNGAIAGAHYECTREGRAVRIHPLCLLLRFEPPGGQTSSTVHWLHEEHPLKDLYSPKEYVCDGCGDAGTGRRLRCREVDCDFALHPYCSSLPREEQREPCFLCGPAGAAHGSFRTADPSWKGQCLLCNGEISRTETAAGMHLWCQESGSAAHPLCARLRQLEQPCRTQTSSSSSSTTTTTTTTQNASGQHPPGGDQVTRELKNAGGESRNPDEVASFLVKAKVVGGKLGQRILYRLLAKAVIDGGSAVYAKYIEPAHVGDDCLAAAADAKAHLVDGVSDAVHGVEEAGTSVLHEVSDAFHGVKEAGTSVLHEVSYAFHGVEHGVEEAATSVLHEVSDAFHGVEEAGTSVLEAVLNVLETLSNFF